MPGTTSINGVISGLSTDDIISKLLELERAPILRLQAKQDSLQLKISAWQEINTRILALKSKADTLAKSSTFDTKSLSSDDEDIIKGTAGYTAQTGIYYLKVNQLAKAHQLKSDGYADTNTTKVGNGTITITVGTGAPKVITIDDTNNTLEGLKQVINQSDAGVTATIVNDGTGETPYRLVISSNKVGQSGQMTVNLDLSGGTAPVLSTMQEAQSASVTLGEGAGAITVTKDSNSISDLIPGVTLNLQKADTGKTVIVTIKEDTETLKKSVKEFIEQYNNLIEYINRQFKFDIETNKGGVLFSDFNLETIQSDLMNKMFNPVSELNQTIKVLSQIGITAKSDNTLELDEFRLDEVIKEGVSAVKGLFAAVGQATSGAISYLSCTSDTKATPLDAFGNPIGYAIEITQVATQTRLTAGIAQVGVLAQDEQITINGTSIQLTAGLTADQVVTRINEYTSKTGVTASRTADGYLTLTNVQYGTRAITVSSNVTGAGSSGLANALSRVTAGTAQTENLAQNETLTVNGVTIELTAGMTKAQVISKINEYSTQTGVTASRTGADGNGVGDYLTLVSRVPGGSISAVSSISTSGVNNTSGIGNVLVTQADPGGETGAGTGVTGTATGALGTDVAGTINGKAATGKGQTLTSDEGDSKGLSIRVTATTIGSYGTISLTRGIGSILSGYLDYITRPTTGLVNSTRDALQTEIEALDDDIKVYEERVAAKQDRLIAQFAAMESALNKLKNEGTYLSSQLTAASNGWRR